MVLLNGRDGSVVQPLPDRPQTQDFIPSTTEEKKKKKVLFFKMQMC